MSHYYVPQYMTSNAHCIILAAYATISGIFKNTVIPRYSRLMCSRTTRERSDPRNRDKIFILLFICVAHCLCSLSTLRCGVEKSLSTTNETVFSAHINLSVGSARQNTLHSTNNATQAETAAVQKLSISLFEYKLSVCEPSS